MSSVDIAIGKIDYEESGPAGGRPAVFVHGFMMAANLWAQLTERLSAGGLRCIVPTLPLGAHSTPMADRDALTIPGIASSLADFLTALELEDVVLVGNDTGGLISQIVAGSHSERLGALVLTSCDAFEHWPPPVLKPFQIAAKTSPTFRAAMQPMRTRFARQRAYGELAHLLDIDELAAGWVAPALRDSAIAEDARRLTASLDGQTALDAAARLGEFHKPALVAWSADDSFFPVEDGRRLAAALPDARLAVTPGARTFSMLDQTDALAGLIAEFVGARAPTAA